MNRTGKGQAWANTTGGRRPYLARTLPLALLAAFLLLPIAQAPAAPPQVSGTKANPYATTARLESTVNPEGKATTYQFEYLPQAQWEAEGFTGATKVPASPVAIGSGSTEVPVAEEIFGLEPVTTYRFRLLASSGEGTSEGQSTFTTLHAISASQMHATSAHLDGLINPEGKATTYQFQYLPLSEWEASGFEGAAQAPAPPASIGAGFRDVAVTELLSGLQPATTYRARILALRGEGPLEELEATTFTTYSLPQVFGPCSNEQLRYGPGAALPDCRAYEQASPVDKNGGNVGGQVALAKASLAGDGVTFESQAGVPGGDGSQDFPLYMASREGGAWITRGLLPPGTKSETGSVLGWTPDFSLTFDTAAQYGGPAALLARPRQSNPVTEIVPPADSPNYFLSGAAADNETALFAATGALAVKAGDPAPAPGEQNVYAWDRAGKELSLAGVLPDGSVPTEGSTLTGGYMQETRAISTDGSVFFVDRESGQLYLRLHPTEQETAAKDGKGNCVPDPVLACTLAISTSQRTTPDPGGLFKPTFQAASADGSTTFFTSAEELTDEAKTTAVPEVIGRGDISGSEAAGVEGAFITGPDVSALAASATHLWWVNSAAGTIGRVGLDGEGEEPECITLPEIEIEAGVFAPPNPKGIAVGVGADSNHLYWTNPTDGGAGHGTIGRADISGSCAAAKASAEPEFISGATNPLGIDSDGTYLYWANLGSTFATKAIARATLDGTSEVDFAWFTDTPHASGVDVAVDAAHDYLFVARGFGGLIARAKLSDPGDKPIFLPAEGAEQIDSDAGHIYWTYHPSGAATPQSIARADLDGKGVETNFISARNAAGVAVGAGTDSGHLYWGAHPAGRGEDLYRFDAKTGELTDLAIPEKATRGADVQGLLGTSADGTHAYFVANGPFDGGSEGGCAGASGSCNLYLWHEDPEGGSAISFIARLDGGGGSRGDFADWVREGGELAGLAQKTARVTPDGGAVLFRSSRRLSGYDNANGSVPDCVGTGGRCAELYLWHPGDTEPTCVSCNPSGAPPVGPATLGTLEAPFLGASLQMSLLSRNLSADGDRVFFETRDSLLAADSNGDEACPGWGSGSQEISIKACQDVYEWEANGSGSCQSEAHNGGCLYLLSTGTSDQASFFADADPSGENAFIFTASQLVGQDEDQLMDVYDVRVGGGLASQLKDEAPACEGEACQGSPPPPPAARIPGSAGFSGEGNQASKKRQHKKKHRKKKHAKHKRQQQAKKGRGPRR